MMLRSLLGQILEVLSCSKLGTRCVAERGGCRHSTRCFSFVLGLCLLATNAQAVILFSTGDPEANTSPPPREQGGEGWELQGQWGRFLGTPIAPRFFITARHVLVNAADGFRFRGVDYPVTAFHDDSGSDLRIGRVCGEFPAHASLYTRSDELGREFVMFGRGTQRGEAVEVNGALKGWRWGASDGRMRWGRNRIEGMLAASELGFKVPPTIGPAFFMSRFDPDGLPDEAHLSTGDSAGGLFLSDGGEWKLAGILYAVEGPFNLEPDGAGFFGAIFDKQELYERKNQEWILVPRQAPGSLGSAFFASRISVRLDWIHQVLASAEDNPAVVALQSSAEAAGPFVDDPMAQVDLAGQIIRLPIVATMRFLRIQSCRPVLISRVALEASEVVIRFSFR